MHACHAAACTPVACTRRRRRPPRPRFSHELQELTSLVRRCSCRCLSLRQAVSEGGTVADEDFLQRYSAAEGCAESAATRQRQSHLMDEMFAKLESMNERED